jgi:hypothetical protein
MSSHCPGLAGTEQTLVNLRSWLIATGIGDAVRPITGRRRRHSLPYPLGAPDLPRHRDHLDLRVPFG